jgi:hypothetical protein
MTLPFKGSYGSVADLITAPRPAESVAFAYVSAPQDTYVWNAAADDAPGSTVFAPDPTVSGRWSNDPAFVAVAIARAGLNPAWFQANWHINATTGSDNNDGATSGTALLTFNEIVRRMGPNPVLQQNTTIAIDSATAMTAADRLVMQSWRGVAGATVLTIAGSVAAGATLGAITAVSPIDHTVQDGALKVTIGAIVWPARRTRVRISGGPRDGAVAYVVNPNIAAGQSRLSPFTTTAGILPTIVTPQLGDVIVVETTTQFQKPIGLLSNQIKFLMSDVEFLDDASGQFIGHDGLISIFKHCYFHGIVRGSTKVNSVLFNGCEFDAINAGVFNNGPTVSNLLACFVDSTGGAGVEGFWQVDLDTIIDGGGTGDGVNSNYGYLTVLGDVALYNTRNADGAIFAQVGAKITNKPIFAGSTLYGTGNGYVWEVTGGSQVWIADTAKIKIVGATNYALFAGVAAAGPLIALDAFGNAIYQLDAGS